jgi:hypothetical protein
MILFFIPTIFINEEKNFISKNKFENEKEKNALVIFLQSILPIDLSREYNPLWKIFKNIL